MPYETDCGTIRVCHVAMGDLWAGAEVQLVALANVLFKVPDLKISAVLFNDGRLASELRTLGVPVTVLPEAKRNGLMILRELIAYCRAHKFDLLHTHKYKDNILATIAAARSGIPHVVRTVHGLSEPFKGIRSLRMGFYELCDEIAIRKKVDRLIAVSSQIEQVLKRKYGSGKVVQIHNGVRIEQVQRAKTQGEVRKQLDVDPKRVIIGTVGRLTAVKGHEHFLAAAQLLLQKRKDLFFMIVGDGPLLDSLKRIARELDIHNNVKFLGHRDDTHDLMRAMDIFVLPSLHEGIPMVLLEAMALARPVIASDVGGIPEVMADRVHGLLVSAADPVELARACEMFLNNPVLSESCGYAGLIRVKQEFSSELMGRKVISLYRELLAG